MKFRKRSLCGLWINSKSHAVHPCFDWNTAGQSGIWLQVRLCLGEYKSFLLTHSISLFVDSIVPVVLKNYSASPTLWSVTERIMWSDVWAIGGIVAVTYVRFKSLYSHSCYRFEQWLSFISRYFFINIIHILDEEVNTCISNICTAYFILVRVFMELGHDGRY